MCGIVGFLGTNSCKEPLMKGLTSLEYRGYDSAGIALISLELSHIASLHAVGQLSALKEKMPDFTLDGNLGIGHIRWATHGEPTLENCHPQLDCHSSIAIVHNGIIENYNELKRAFSSAHSLVSSTDTEIIAHLLEELLLEKSTLKEALLSLVSKLEGAFSLAIIIRAYPDMLIGVRKRSPLCLGLAADATYLASDQNAFLGAAQEVMMIPDCSIVIIEPAAIQLFDFQGAERVPERRPLEGVFTGISLEGFKHFMLKEMYEQKQIIHATAKYYFSPSQDPLKQIGLSADALKKIDKIHILACGTSYHAGLMARYFFERIAGIKTFVHIASEFRYDYFWPEEDSLYLAISQSGETADTLEALRMIQSHGLRTVVLTNVLTSTMAYECDGFLPTLAGPEISVCSTKAFSGQVAALYGAAYRIAQLKSLATQSELEAAEGELRKAAQVLEDSVESYKDKMLRDIAPRYAGYSTLLFVGRQESYVSALEAALKLKEISYIFADAVPAGELKHGTLALVDAHTPVVLCSSLDPVIYKKLVSCAQEIKARGARLLVVAFEGQDELTALADDHMTVARVCPLLGGLAQTGLLQLFAYHVASHLNRPIDKPRNLSKSVTVE